jgi:hypothetical protein
LGRDSPPKIQGKTREHHKKHLAGASGGNGITGSHPGHIVNISTEETGP